MIANIEDLRRLVRRVAKTLALICEQLSVSRLLIGVRDVRQVTRNVSYDGGRGRNN